MPHLSYNVDVPYIVMVAILAIFYIRDKGRSVDAHSDAIAILEKKFDGVVQTFGNQIGALTASLAALQAELKTYRQMTEQFNIRLFENAKTETNAKVGRRKQVSM